MHSAREAEARPAELAPAMSLRIVDNGEKSLGLRCLSGVGSQRVARCAHAAVEGMLDVRGEVHRRSEARDDSVLDEPWSWPNGPSDAQVESLPSSQRFVVLGREQWAAFRPARTPVLLPPEQRSK